MKRRPKEPARLRELRQLDDEARGWHPDGFGWLGLHLTPTLERKYYTFISPANGWTFARTGGDGVHFSLLEGLDGVTDSSPVVVTSPCAGLNVVAGANLYDFLCLGMYRGYFCFEELAQDPKGSLPALLSPDWRPTTSRHDAMGFGVDDESRVLLAFLTIRMGLQPWPDAKRFDALQKQFAPLIEWPEEWRRMMEG